MEKQEIKRGMMELWEKIFHDSREFVSLVFDSYFEKGYYAYKEENGHIIASILGIPYDFRFGESKCKGLYLCGISTEPSHRREGLMTQLLDEIEGKAKGNFDFTFLIPSNELNRQIYYNRGYYTAIYKVYQYYTSNHDFKSEFFSSLYGLEDNTIELKKNFFESLSVSLYHKQQEIEENILIDFLENFEKIKKPYLELNHSLNDLKTAIKDNLISKGEIFICQNKKKEITSVIFTYPEHNGRIKLNAFYCKDSVSYFKTLGRIKDYYAEMSLTLLIDPEDAVGGSLWNETSVFPNPDGNMLESLIGTEERVFYHWEHSKPFGMIKILNLHCLISLLSKIKKDLNKQILLKYHDSEQLTFLDIKNGELQIKNIEQTEAEEIKKNKKLIILYFHDFMDIIFRRKKHEDIIMEAFGIPRLPINISLMLD